MTDARARLVQLHLLRHADAGDPGVWLGDDSLRPLSEKGLRQAERLGRHLAALGFEPDAILSSPKVRAAQTAEIVGRALGVEVRLEDRLGGSVTLGVLGVLLAEVPGRTVVLVGHDPDFSELLATLTGAGDVPMKKGALARVDLPDGSATGAGVLRWLLPPDLIPRRDTRS